MTKYCPICKEHKSVSEFNTYYSNARKKRMVQSRCKICAKIDSRRRANLYYAKNREKRKQYARDYKANPANSEKIKKLEAHFRKVYCEELHDCYIRGMLSRQFGIPFEVSKDMPEIIEAKRLQIKIKRKIKTLKNGKE